VSANLWRPYAWGSAPQSEDFFIEISIFHPE